jgi:hypothetical protein
MENEQQATSDGNPSLDAIIADSNLDLSSLRACVILLFADLFDRNPELREHFVNCLKLARNKAQSEKSDAKVLTLDVARSFIQKIPRIHE